MPLNCLHELQLLMDTLDFEKSTLLPLKGCDWHALLWIISPNTVVRHLGGWNITSKHQMQWVLQKINLKIEYWKLSTWPLHVRRKIVQSIIMAYVQFYLPLLHWNSHELASFMSPAMELLWKTKSWKKALRLLKMESVCLPRPHGGLNILNIQYHIFARKSTMISEYFQ